MTQTLEWFKTRINKTVFRNYYKCCKECEDIEKEGVIIRDENHAEYLFDMQNDLSAEGIELDYRDEK